MLKKLRIFLLNSSRKYKIVFVVVFKPYLIIVIFIEIRYVINMLGYYFRLTPALIAVVLFYAYVMEHLGAGPQWTSSVTSNADLCKTHLWRNILYIQNFFMFEEMVSEKS